MRRSFENEGTGSGSGSRLPGEGADAIWAAVWTRVKSKLQLLLGEDKYHSWISPLSLEGVSNGCATLGAPKEYFRFYVDLHFRDQISRMWETESKDIKRVRVETRVAKYGASMTHGRTASRNVEHGAAAQGSQASNSDGQTSQHAEEVNKGDVFAPAKQGGRTEPRHAPLSSAFKSSAFGASGFSSAGFKAPASVSESPLGSEFNPTKTFATFVEGEPNELAFLTGKSFAEMHPDCPNSLYIYGKSGGGKTHLLHAIGQSIVSQHPNFRVLYLSAERFTYHFIRALRDRDTLAFKDALTNVDVLLLDDVQFLSNKQNTQEEVFHVIDILLTAGKKVVCCADVPPSDLDGVNARIVTRMAHGAVVPVGLPDFNLRRKILQAKLKPLREQYGAHFRYNEEIIDFLAEALNADVRTLEGAVAQISMFLRAGKEVDMETVRFQIVSDLIKVGSSDLSIQKIQEVVSDHFGLTIEDLRSKRRTKEFVLARHLAMFLCKEQTPRSYPQIAAKFGGKDHSTIIHAFKKVSKLQNEDDTVRQHLVNLRKKLDRQ